MALCAFNEIWTSAGFIKMGTIWEICADICMSRTGHVENQRHMAHGTFWWYTWVILSQHFEVIPYGFLSWLSTSERCFAQTHHTAQTHHKAMALVLSCEVPGENPLPGARYNAEKLCKIFRRANVTTRCVFGGRLTLDRAKEELQDFFSIESERHLLYGIFHGCNGSWKLSDGSLLGLDDVLEQWDLAKQTGTAEHLMIVSDACESGCMVQEAQVRGRPDITVQASCSGCNPILDNQGETFSELLLWHLEGCPATNRMDGDKERALLQFGPCYYCPDPINYGKRWVFINEDHSFGSLSLVPDSSDTLSSRSLTETEDTFLDLEDPAPAAVQADPVKPEPVRILPKIAWIELLVLCLPFALLSLSAWAIIPQDFQKQLQEGACVNLALVLIATSVAISGHVAEARARVLRSSLRRRRRRAQGRT